MLIESTQQAMWLVDVLEVGDLESGKGPLGEAVGIENRWTQSRIPIAPESSFRIPDRRGRYVLPVECPIPISRAVSA